MTYPADALTAVLDAAYDLTYRPRPGHSSFYCFDIIYRSIGEGGRVRGVENYRGGFSRQVNTVGEQGAEETITWRHPARRERAADGEFGAWQPIEWADGFSYPFNAEADYEDFHWSYAAFPRDDKNWMLSWNVVLLTVDAHFEFDFLRSRRHGAIDKLRHVGDSLVVPDSGHPFWLGLPPIVDVPAFTKRDLRNTFLGIGRSGPVDCAIVGFTMDVSPFQMSIAGNSFDVSSIFRGTLAIRLNDGSLERGEFDEEVIGASGPVYPHYEIRRISEATWQAGTLDLEFD